MIILSYLDGFWWSQASLKALARLYRETVTMSNTSEQSWTFIPAKVCHLTCRWLKCFFDENTENGVSLRPPPIRFLRTQLSRTSQSHTRLCECAGCRPVARWSCPATRACVRLTGVTGTQICRVFRCWRNDHDDMAKGTIKCCQRPFEVVLNYDSNDPMHRSDDWRCSGVGGQ